MTAIALAMPAVGRAAPAPARAEGLQHTGAPATAVLARTAGPASALVPIAAWARIVLRALQVRSAWGRIAAWGSTATSASVAIARHPSAWATPVVSVRAATHFRARAPRGTSRARAAALVWRARTIATGPTACPRSASARTAATATTASGTALRTILRRAAPPVTWTTAASASTALGASVRTAPRPPARGMSAARARIACPTGLVRPKATAARAQIATAAGVWTARRRRATARIAATARTACATARAPRAGTAAWATAATSAWASAAKGFALARGARTR
mmetsp:Transcript_14586/g.29195  ORF Transcript_14586/g.29195 Transcript_14586/m.29195 type:complete len:279 (+) Transcript_14586:348-1184(+)